MQRILSTIREYEMIRPGMHVLAGVSGGADSVCLLYALKEYQKACDFRLTVIHVEHGIRGEESLEDARFVEELCGRLSVPCRTVRCDLPALAASKGRSLEEAARDARYEIFSRMCRELQADVTAVAHNENDQAETVLWNLARGSGLKGLGGIRPAREGLIRPLLFLPRGEIEKILRERGISWRTDSTNLETDYTRNRLRLELLPVMEQRLNRQAARHIAESAAELREVQEYLERRIAEAAGRCVRSYPGGIALKLEAYRQEEPCIQDGLLRACIRGCAADTGLKDIGRIHIRMLRGLAEKDCGKRQNLPGGLTVYRQRDLLVFGREQKRQRDERVFSIPEAGVLEVDGLIVRTELLAGESVDREEILQEKKYTKWLSCDTITGNVSLRKRRAGDYITVNAAGGRKKLGDYMTDQKIPAEERDAMWLVADGSHVLWLPGYRISEAAKVTEKTKRVLKISVRIEKETEDETA